MRASLVRISRKASRTQRRKNAAMPNSTGAVPIEKSASFQSMPKIATRMKTRRIMSPSRLTRPEANISLSASMSLVIRVISRPTGVRSKKDADSDSTCSCTRTRKVFIPRWPMSCVR